MNEWEESFKNYYKSGQMTTVYESQTGGTALTMNLENGNLLMFAVFAPKPGEHFMQGGIAYAANFDANKYLSAGVADLQEPENDASPEQWVSFYRECKRLHKRITWNDVAKKARVTSGALRAKDYRMKHRNKT